MNIESALKLIKVSGENSTKFLQGQLTCDITKVGAQNFVPLQLGAHCNIKGRVESLFEIFKQDDDYYLLMPSSIIDHAYNLLKKYAAFSKVTLTIINLSEVTLPVELPETFNDWRLQQITKGLPTLFPETIGKFLPHDINLPTLNAVSFNKGCYLGQEIVARMQHLGKPKYHMVFKNISGASGEELPDGGIIVDAVDNQALVVTHI